MANTLMDDIPPPDPGFSTVTSMLSAAARSDALMDARRTVALTNSVARVLPPQCTEASAANPLPVRRRVKAGDPDSTEAGLIASSVGLPGPSGPSSPPHPTASTAKTESTARQRDGRHAIGRGRTTSLMEQGQLSWSRWAAGAGRRALAKVVAGTDGW